MKNIKKKHDINMNWIDYIGLNEIDSFIIKNNCEQLEKKRNKYNNQKNKILKVEFDDDYDSSWTKYVGIDRKTREDLKKIEIMKNNQFISLNDIKEEDEYLLTQNANATDNYLTDEIIKKKIENLKPKKKVENFIDSNFDIPLEIKKERNINKYTNNNLNDINNNTEINNKNIHNCNDNNNNNNHNNDTTESDGYSKIFKNIKIPCDKSLKFQNPELEKSKINNVELLGVNTNLKIGNLSKENLLKNNEKEEEIIIQNNGNLIKKGNKDYYSSQNNFALPFKSYRAIQISTQSPIQPNYNKNNIVKSTKNKIFQVNSIPKIKQENNVNNLINQKRKRENSNLNIMKKLETPSIKNEINNFNNNSPISAIKKLTQTPSLFSNQFESNNMIFKDDFSNFQLDNFSSLNNDLSITNNDISDLNNKKNPVSSNPNQEINNINNQNNFNNKNMNLNNNIFDRYINNEYEEINNQNNIDMTNNNLNINENSPFKNKLIISKKNGKIVIKSIPTKIDDEF